MHPYEMAATLKERHKEESIKLRYGSLYTVIDMLLARALVAAKEVSRGASGRSERSTLTPAGLDELRDWMRELLRDPAKEYPQFEAGLCLMPVLPPDEAVSLLRQRALQLSGTVWKMEGQLAELAQQDLSALTAGEHLPAPLADQKFPPLFAVESEFRLALVNAEFAFVNELVRRIVEEGWGPVEMWRDVQAACDKQHEKSE